MELCELQARRGEVGLQALGGELRADLRAQLLALGELDLEADLAAAGLELLELHTDPDGLFALSVSRTR